MDVRIFWACVMECVCAQTRPPFILSSERVFGEWSQNPCQLQGKNRLYQKNSPQRSIEPTMLHHAGQWAQHTTNELCRPPLHLSQLSGSWQVWGLSFCWYSPLISFSVFLSCCLLTLFQIDLFWQVLFILKHDPTVSSFLGGGGGGGGTNLFILDQYSSHWYDSTWKKDPWWKRDSNPGLLPLRQTLNHLASETAAGSDPWISFSRGGRLTARHHLGDTVIIVIIIIIAFKGAVWYFRQSPHCATNWLQHVRSSDPGEIVCKSHAHIEHLSHATYRVACHVVQRDSSAIKTDRV